MPECRPGSASSSEDRDGSGSDAQPGDDEDAAPEDLAAEEGENPGNGEDDRQDPKNEVQARQEFQQRLAARAGRAPGSGCSGMRPGPCRRTPGCPKPPAP